jgi:hypothetical protein
MNVQKLGELTKRELVNLGPILVDCVKGLFVGGLGVLYVLDILAAKVKDLGRRRYRQSIITKYCHRHRHHRYR